MDPLGAFRIPASALRAAESTYAWTLEPEFFNLLDEDHPAPEGQFRVFLVLRRLAGVVTLEIQVEGSWKAACDRCNAPVTIPVEGTYQVIVKTGDPRESTDEVIFLDPEATEFSVAQLVYDFALLTLPVSRKLEGCENMEPSPCDRTILDYLEKHDQGAGPDDTDDSPWNDLKNALDN